METIKTWVDGAVTYRIMVGPEDVPVRGNAMASGDDEADRKVEDDLIRRLDSGDMWAWFSARVEAEAFGFKGADTLGCCSYNDQADFLAMEEQGYLRDMSQAARSALDDAMLRARVALDEAEQTGFLLCCVKREQAIRAAAEAFARGAAEADNDFTWADPARPADGALTALDEAYDHGRTWAENHLPEVTP